MGASASDLRQGREDMLFYVHALFISERDHIS